MPGPHKDPCKHCFPREWCRTGFDANVGELDPFYTRIGAAGGTQGPK